MTEKEKKTTLNSMIGDEIIALLDLPIKNGRIDTTWGTKTPVGLGATIRRIIEDCTILAG